MARKGNPISVRRDLPVFWFLIYFYILGFNLIITIKLLMDWGIPHILVIGWKGVSLTPPSKRTKQGSFCSNFSLASFFFFSAGKNNVIERRLKLQLPFRCFSKTHFGCSHCVAFFFFFFSIVEQLWVPNGIKFWRPGCAYSPGFWAVKQWLPKPFFFLVRAFRTFPTTSPDGHKKAQVSKFFQNLRAPLW